LFPAQRKWTQGEVLQAEREVFGFFLTGHPLEEHLAQLRHLGDTTLAQLTEKEHESTAIIPVFVSAMREYRTQSGNTMAFVQIDDLTGSAELIVFAKTYEKYRDALHADKPILLAARVDTSKEKPSLLAENIALLEDILPELIGRIHINSSSFLWDKDMVAGLKQWCVQQTYQQEEMPEPVQPEHPSIPLHFALRLPDGSIADLESLSTKFLWHEQSQAWLDLHLDASAVMLECKPWNVKFGAQRRQYQSGQG